MLIAPQTIRRLHYATVKASPESVQHRSIRVETDHPVLHCDAVDKGLLVVEEISVRDPQLVGHSVIQSQVVSDLRVGQALVPPRLLEVHRQGVILPDRGGPHLVPKSNSMCSLYFFHMRIGVCFIFITISSITSEPRHAVWALHSEKVSQKVDGGLKGHSLH